MKAFNGGKAVFHQAPLPIKCPGAPQKIMHLSHDHWKKSSAKADIEFFTAIPVIFGVPKYAKVLQAEADKKNINVNFEHKLLEIRGKDRVAVFADKDGNQREVKFDALHAVPPQRPIEFLRNNNNITNEAGYVEVDNGTLRSTRYGNIWSLGDCSSLPTSKTAAAIMSQTPILIHNMLKVWRDKLENPEFCIYKGYTSCPLFVGDGKLQLAEFRYNAEVDETFPGLQNGPNSLFYHFKTKLFPFAYFNLMPYGLWYGRSGLLKPNHVYI